MIDVKNQSNQLQGSSVNMNLKYNINRIMMIDN